MTVNFSDVDRPYYKGDEELILYAREYSRDCENKEYRRLARKGLLEETLQKPPMNAAPAPTN